MSKVAVVFWSGTGNTEAMAKFVAQGVEEAGGTAELMSPGDFSSSLIADYDALAFGCPAMGSEELEEDEFAPMWDEVEPNLGASKVALFGSYDWADGEWMELWEQRAVDAGVSVMQTVIAKDYPDDAAAAECVALGKALAE